MQQASKDCDINYFRYIFEEKHPTAFKGNFDTEDIDQVDLQVTDPVGKLKKISKKESDIDTSEGDKKKFEEQ